MDLKLFFDPIDESLSDKGFTTDSLIQSVYINEEKMPDIKDMDIAIIGIKETKGGNGISDTGVKYIREKLYQLKRSEGSCNIIDIGNLRNGPDLDETYKRLKAVSHYLMHNIDLGQYMAYEEEEKLITVCNVDSRFDISDHKHEPYENHIHQIFIHEPNFLFDYNQLGHQSYFVNPNIRKLIDQLSFSSMRIGEMREDFKKVEPIVREADMLTFDLSAIQKMYTPGGNRSNVFGLTGEEACQIMWYAGINEKLSSAGVYEYNPDKDTNDRQSAQVVATMVWYFIEGFKNRKNEKGFQTNDYIKYVVTMDTEPESITLYKSRLSDKWWMEVPKLNYKGVYDRNAIVPCDHNDYQTALDGDVPERWINTFAKFS